MRTGGRSHEAPAILLRSVGRGDRIAPFLGAHRRQRPRPLAPRGEWQHQSHVSGRDGEPIMAPLTARSCSATPSSNGVKEPSARERATAQAIWLSRQRFRSGSAAPRALDILPHYPVFTVGPLARLLDVSWKQAANATEQLTATGILEERTGYRRNRLFAAREALSVINRPFGEEPVLPEETV